jgi:hypothetical protein
MEGSATSPFEIRQSDFKEGRTPLYDLARRDYSSGGAKQFQIGGAAEDLAYKGAPVGGELPRATGQIRLYHLKTKGGFGSLPGRCPAADRRHVFDRAATELKGSAARFLER